MDKLEALAERGRLQNLLASYEASRRAQQEEDARAEFPNDPTPDRADKVRARIVRLDELIAKIEMTKDLGGEKRT